MSDFTPEQQAAIEEERAAARAYHRYSIALREGTAAPDCGIAARRWRVSHIYAVSLGLRWNGKEWDRDE